MEVMQRGEDRDTHIAAYIQLHGPVFEAVQKNEVFPDSKTFVDCVPKNPPQDIITAFNEKRWQDDFDLLQFVEDNFVLPEKIEPVERQPGNTDMVTHIQELWEALSRPAHENVLSRSTLIPMVHPYVVPGGRFREMYYWDSYFAGEGLAACGNMELVAAVVRNFAYLIERFGFIPNGNRIYYLSRSQPPVFAHLLKVIARHNGREAVVPYLNHLETEYRFWMDGEEHVTLEDATHRRIVHTGDAILNRYWDDRATPRPEAYREDREIAAQIDDTRKPRLFRDIRAACESGWDFSSRWFAGTDITTIDTTSLLPVDLNALLYDVESCLADWFTHAGRGDQAAAYRNAANARKQAFDTYFWDDNEQFYFDYHWKDGEQTDTWSLAAVAPLFVGLASQQQAAHVADHLEETFLHEGGLVTTLTETGQQWDKPNGWAPLHWMAINGLHSYGHTELARQVTDRWLQLNENVFNRTGRMMEKYNVIDTSLEAGGGEYPLQDGFGWTNGVAIALRKNELVTPTPTPEPEPEPVPDTE